MAISKGTKVRVRQDIADVDDAGAGEVITNEMIEMGGFEGTVLGSHPGWLDEKKEVYVLEEDPSRWCWAEEWLEVIDD